MVAAILLGGGIYALVTLGVGVVLPYPELLAANHVWTTGYVARFTLGSVGSIILALTVLAAILTGINGFYIATSRLLFGMARAKFLPECFNRVHHKHHSPHCTVVFTMIVALTASWFGREALNWVVDMSAIGTVIAYGFTGSEGDLPYRARFFPVGTEREIYKRKYTDKNDIVQRVLKASNYDAFFAYERI